MRARVWTKCYSPFILGGDVHSPIMAEVDLTGPVLLSHGLEVLVGVSPRGHTAVFEKESGGLVGNDLETVQRDAEEADPNTCRRQIRDAIKFLERHPPRIVDQNEFWRKLEEAR